MKLDENDQTILDSLVDPDKEMEVRYPFDDDFLKVMLGTLLSNRFFLSQCVGLIKPSYFKSEIHQVTCDLLFTYFDRYKQLPSKIFIKQLVDDYLKNRHKNDDKYKAIKIVYIAELNLIYDYYTKGGVGNLMPTLDSPDAILDKIATFARTQAVKRAWASSIELIKKNPEAEETWIKIDELYKEARLVNRNFDIGLDYFESPEERYKRIEENAANLETFTLGFRSLDNCLVGGGLTRGELGAVMALAGAGKSLWLAWVTSQNIAKGKKVLYISTEMDQDRIASRFDSMFSLIGQHELMVKREEVWQALRDTITEYEDKRRLIIKQFPSGTVDVTGVRAYHSQLTMMGFKPDLVIIDYPGDFKDYAGLDLWHSRYRMLREIRGFGVEEKHCTLVAIHPNKSSKELTLEEFMDEGNTGDSFKQNQVFDFFLTLNQTSGERRANIARGFVAKARNGKSRFPFWLRFHFKDQTLRLEEISRHTYDVEFTKVRDMASDDVEIDKVPEDKSNGKKKKFEPSDGEQMA